MISRAGGWGRRMPMFALSALMLGVGIGCMPPEVRLAAMPVERPSEDLQNAQKRVVPLGKEVAFARSLEAILDMGFQIRCANQESGQINVHRTWVDRAQGGAELSIEITLLYRSEGPQATQIRMAAQGQWKRVSVGQDSSADVSGKASDQTPSDVAAFMDRLVAGICPTAR